MFCRCEQHTTVVLSKLQNWNPSPLVCSTLFPTSKQFNITELLENMFRQKNAQPTSVPKAEWEWNGDGNRWYSYGDYRSRQLDEARATGESSVKFALLSDDSRVKWYTVDFDTMKQTQQSTGFERDVRRTAPLWEWKNDDNCWHSYSAPHTQQLEAGWSTGQVVKFSVSSADGAGTKGYSVDVKAMQQTQTSTGHVREVRRTGPPASVPLPAAQPVVQNRVRLNTVAPPASVSLPAAQPVVQNLGRQNTVAPPASVPSTAQWEWKGDNNHWHSYSAPHTQQLEAGWRTGQVVKFSVPSADGAGTKGYSVDVKAMEQTQTSTGFVREVRRTVPPASVPLPSAKPVVKNRVRQNTVAPPANVPSTAQWEWKGDNHWHSYSAPHTQQLEAGWSTGQVVKFSVPSADGAGTKGYSVDVKAMEQTQTSTGFVREVRRTVPPASVPLPLPAAQPAPSVQIRGRQKTVAPRLFAGAQWEWKGDDNCWHSYSPAHIQQLEAARGTGRCVSFSVPSADGAGTKGYSVDVKAMEQTQTSTGHVREVRRTLLGSGRPSPGNEPPKKEWLEDVFVAAEQFAKNNFPSGHGTWNFHRNESILYKKGMRIQPALRKLLANCPDKKNVSASLGRFGWHGTATMDNVLTICSEGWDPSKRNGQQYGQGEYFAHRADTSFSYAKSTDVLIVAFILEGSWLNDTTHLVVDNPTNNKDSYVVPVGVVAYNGTPCPKFHTPHLRSRSVGPVRSTHHAKRRSRSVW